MLAFSPDEKKEDKLQYVIQRVGMLFHIAIKQLTTNITTYVTLLQFSKA